MVKQQFTFRCPNQYGSNKIEVIKAIRVLTGMGLKEAKDASERTDYQTMDLNTSAFISAHADPDVFVQEQFRILRNAGVEVGDPVYKILSELRSLASQAILQGDDELGNEILQLVLAEKLRRKQ